MRLNNILNELKDIPIKDFKTDNAGKNFEKVEKPKIEPDRSFRFNPNDYHLKKGALTANSESALEKKIDEFLEKTKNRMSTVYKYSSDGKTAFLVYYDRDISSLDEKYKKSLYNKIDDYARKYSKEGIPTTKKPESSNFKSNIQKALDTLSDNSLKDLDSYVKILQKRDGYDRKK